MSENISVPKLCSLHKDCHDWLIVLKGDEQPFAEIKVCEKCYLLYTNGQFFAAYDSKEKLEITLLLLYASTYGKWEGR